MVNPPRRPFSALRRRLRPCFTVFTAIGLLIAFHSSARADGIDLFGRGTAEGEARFASGTGNIVYLATGTLLPLAEDGKEGAQHSLRTVDSLLTATLVAEALKQITHERRPDGSERTSFPSGHATAAFAVATMQAHYHHRQAPFWYGGAALIGASRVQLNRHYWHDVIAGAGIGYFTTRLELHSKHGLILRPVIHSNANELGSRAAALDGLDHIYGRDVSVRGVVANGFAPYMGESDGSRNLGLSFSRAF